LFEQLDYLDNFFQIDALDRAYDVRLVAFWKIHVLKLAKWLPLTALQRVRATALPAFVLRDLTTFNDEDSACFVLVSPRL
jgi:hypothetical protein